MKSIREIPKENTEKSKEIEKKFFEKYHKKIQEKQGDQVEVKEK